MGEGGSVDQQLRHIGRWNLKKKIPNNRNKANVKLTVVASLIICFLMVNLSKFFSSILSFWSAENFGSNLMFAIWTSPQSWIFRFILAEWTPDRSRARRSIVQESMETLTTWTKVWFQIKILQGLGVGLRPNASHKEQKKQIGSQGTNINISWYLNTTWTNKQQLHNHGQSYICWGTGLVNVWILMTETFPREWA